MNHKSLNENHKKHQVDHKITRKLENLGLEDVFPRGEIDIYVATWNMNCKAPPDDLTNFIPKKYRDDIPEILVFGSQECTSDKSWEIGLQKLIGPSHVLYHTTIKKHSAIRLAIFMNRALIWYCSEPVVETILLSWSTRSTKGAVSIGLELFGYSFLFIACHLAAHEENLDRRLDNVKEIKKNFAKEHDCVDLGNKFDYIFWSGDMNFRITRPRGEVLNWVSKSHYPLEHSAQAYSGEQLTESIQDGLVFRGYKEAPITFPPTYKFDVGTDNYDTSHKQRTPSYTDRIIYKSSKHHDGIKCLAYDHVPTIRTSDHKPVYGMFRVKVDPGSAKVSATAGYFHRKVYLAAMKEEKEEEDKN